MNIKINDQFSTGTGMFVIFCIFLFGKLTGYIDWSWWFVTMPLWIRLAMIIIILLVSLIILLSSYFFDAIIKIIKR